MSVESEEVRAWRVAKRWSALRGEERANLVRILAIAVFYGVQILNVHGLTIGPLAIPAVPGVGGTFHRLMSLVALAGILSACLVLVALRNRYFPAWLPYVTTGLDVVLATTALVVADGPRSALIVVYFPIVALTALRACPTLVRFATVSAVCGYLFLVLVADLLRPELSAPRYHSILMVLSLGLVGLALDRAAHEVGVIAGQYAIRAARGTPFTTAPKASTHEREDGSP